MKNGQVVSQFERAFADHVGAKYAIACANGTVTLSAALSALGVQPGDRVATTPLTMSATSISILNVGAVPVYADVDARTWLLADADTTCAAAMPVSLYGLHQPSTAAWTIDDAAQTLRRHGGCAFTSYSFQASKILTTGEGGMLVTDDDALAMAARSYLSLGYAMRADQARIDPATLKASDFARHHRSPAVNGRMNDVTAALGLKRLAHAEVLLAARRECASFYADAICGCDWLTPQHVPDGWTHDYWCYTVLCDTPERARWLQQAVVEKGGEMPFGAWRLTYHEPAFKHLAPTREEDFVMDDGGDAYRVIPSSLPIAESLQPRLLQLQTNHRMSASKNARALARAIASAPPIRGRD